MPSSFARYVVGCLSSWGDGSVLGWIPVVFCAVVMSLMRGWIWVCPVGSCCVCLIMLMAWVHSLSAYQFAVVMAMHGDAWWSLLFVLGVFSFPVFVSWWLLTFIVHRMPSVWACWFDHGLSLVHFCIDPWRESRICLWVLVVGWSAGFGWFSAFSHLLVVLFPRLE